MKRSSVVGTVSQANKDDGSCTAVLLGCTNPTAANYNASANRDDDSCNAALELNLFRTE